MIERQFQSEYTQAKFKEVQSEFRAKINCFVVSVNSVGHATCYDVVEESIIGTHPRETQFRVNFNREDRDVSCSCLLFEFKGIMCRHSLLVLAQERVKNVPSKFILPRWSKNLRRKYSRMKTSYDIKTLQPQVERFDGLCKRFYEIAEFAAESSDITSLLYETMNSFEEKVHEVHTNSHGIPKGDGHANTKNPVERLEECSPQQSVMDIRSPLHVVRKGRPCTKRKMSTVERVVRKRKAAKSNNTPVVTTHVSFNIWNL